MALVTSQRAPKVTAMRTSLRQLLHRSPAALPTAPGRPRPGKTVLVCSGGGLLGAAQAGMLEVLLAAGLRVDAVVGVSAGALNGTFVAADPHPGRGADLVATWMGLPKRGVFGGRAVERLWALLARHDALHSGDALRDLVAAAVPLADLSHTLVPVHVATCDLADGRAVWWSSGPPVPVLAASASVPGALPPVRIEGRDHVDGGIVTNVPVARAVEIGATRIVCLDVSAGLAAAPAPETAVGVLLRAFAVSRAALTASELAAVPETVELHHLRVEAPRGLGLTDFTKVPTLVELGRDCARAHLAALGLDGLPAPTAARAPQPA